jgi:hypothetical protein
MEREFGREAGDAGDHVHRMNTAKVELQRPGLESPAPKAVASGIEQKYSSLVY